MEPRSFDRGDRIRSRPPVSRFLVASMEPRSFDRGDLTGLLVCNQVSFELQWSRGLLTAETVRRIRSRHVARLASMEPRSFDRGDRAGRSSICSTTGRFNGAAVF